MADLQFTDQPTDWLIDGQAACWLNDSTDWLADLLSDCLTKWTTRGSMYEGNRLIVEPVLVAFLLRISLA